MEHALGVLIDGKKDMKQFNNINNLDRNLNDDTEDEDDDDDDDARDNTKNNNKTIEINPNDNLDNDDPFADSES